MLKAATTIMIVQSPLNSIIEINIINSMVCLLLLLLSDLSFIVPCKMRCDPSRSAPRPCPSADRFQSRLRLRALRRLSGGQPSVQQRGGVEWIAQVVEQERKNRKLAGVSRGRGSKR